MNKTILIMALLLFFSSYAMAEYDLNVCSGDGNFMKIGECITHGAFSGSLELLAFIFFLAFAIFAWQTKMPIGASLLLGLVLVFAMTGMLPSNLDNLLMSLAILVIAVMVALSILHFVRR